MEGKLQCGQEKSGLLTPLQVKFSEILPTNVSFIRIHEVNVYLRRNDCLSIWLPKLPEAEIRDIDQSRDVDRGDKISW